MKASDYGRGWNGDGPFDALKDHIEADEGKTALEELDSYWSEVTKLAERYGFLVAAAGGVATIATHKAYIAERGADDEAARLRMCNVDLGDAFCSRERAMRRTPRTADRLKGGA